ncbi:MAG TPA: hypothetical protein VGC21_25885 [Telluria sp.]
MSNLAVLHHQHALAPSDSPFWCAALGEASTEMPEMASRIDALSRDMARLPVRAALTRPVVGQYLSMVRTLAAAWQARSRPALGAAFGMLAFVGRSMAEPPILAQLQKRTTAPQAVDGLRRRMAAPLAAFDALGADLASYLAQMARASLELESDTALVTERLQADGVHAFLLSQQASALQSRLDDAGLRQDAHWLGPHAGHLRQEIVLHASALEGVRRQLAQLQSEQAATRAEADYLQSMLPALAAYLGAVESMGAAIDTLRDGAARTSHALALLATELAHAGPGQAVAQLEAALPRWAAVAGAASALQR